LIGSKGLVQQIDSEPGGGSDPTTSWQTNVTVIDHYSLVVPNNLPPGEYELRTGMYPPGQPLNRLVVTDPGKTSVDSNSILIKTITVLP
jgi:hypothetical protein